jgi:hypothetical protein
MKNYFDDNRSMPIDRTWDCCDCRNTIYIKIVGRYPHGTDNINFCPVCGARTSGSAPSFRCSEPT